VKDRGERDVVRPQLRRDREVLLAPDVGSEELLLQDLAFPLARVLPARVQEDLVGEDDERIPDLVVEGLEPRVLPGLPTLLGQDLLEAALRLEELDADS